MGTHEHKTGAPKRVKVGIITVSTTRTLAEDTGGGWIKNQAGTEGHEVVYHQVIPDEAELIAKTALDVIRQIKPQVLLLTGGTGISSQDVTIEAIGPMFTKELTSFGPLFAQLSFKEIGSAAILSRATAGVIEEVIVFCIPGSINACKLACQALIFPELGHLAKHVHEG